MTWSPAEWTVFVPAAVLYAYWLYQMAIAVNGLRSHRVRYMGDLARP